MTVAQPRAAAHISFTGTASIDLLTDYRHAVRLRETLAGVDQGFYSFRPFDPGVLPAGNGYLAHLFDKPGGTLLATGTATQRGQRSVIELTSNGTLPEEGSQLSLTYPDMSDETAATLTTVTRLYTATRITPATTANTIYTGTTVAEWLDNLATAINGTGDYMASEVGPATDRCYELVARRISDTVISIEARQGGTWGNRMTYVEVDPGSGEATNFTTTALTYGTGGTGNHGLLVRFDESVLPKTLITTPNTTLSAHVEVFGLDSNNNPTKLIHGPAQLYASSVVL